LLLALSAPAMLPATARAADASEATPPAAVDANRDEEARRILRETLAKLDPPSPAAKALPVVKVAPTDATKPAAEVAAKAEEKTTSERAKGVPAEAPAKTLAAQPVQVAVVQDAAKAASADVAQPARTPLEKVSEGKTLYSFKAEELEIKKA